MAHEVNVITDFSVYRSMRVPRQQRAQQAVADQLLASANPYVPMKTGDLRSQTSVALDGSFLRYHAPYAIYQYDKKYSNYTTSGTGPRWDKVALTNHRDAIIRAGAVPWN